MKTLGPMGEHYFLALGMAKAAGVNLSDAIDSGRFDQAQWADLVHRCRGCAWGDDCPGWLKEHHTIDTPPATCPNAGVFSGLRTAQGGAAPQDSDG